MVENSLGWASLMSTLKGLLCGAMEHRLTFATGRNTSQITPTMRTVFILLGFFEVISTNGMMSIAQTVTDSPAREVRLAHFVSFRLMLLGNHDKGGVAWQLERLRSRIKIVSLATRCSCIRRSLIQLLLTRAL